MHKVIVRCLEGLIAIWGVVTIVFIVSRLLGDPAVLMLPPGATAAQLAELREKLGLHGSLLSQYVDFMRAVIRGDFGSSFQFDRPALSVVLDRLPATLSLAFLALGIGLFGGMLAGTVAAVNQGSFAGGLLMMLALLGQATPAFWLGVLLIMILSVKLQWLPVGGYGHWQSFILPAITLACFTSASIARLLRSSMLETLTEDFVRTARAKGLRPGRILIWHVGKNSVLPVLTMAGILTGELLGGAAVTESVFSWPGVGRLIVQSIQAKDFPVVQAGVAIIAATFIAVNILVDCLYVVIDPRVGR
ncbi:ABC transporter permease [Paraburkholderia piptadeniae]|nr:ABC transporter permease [Paraburkholderia piptadeniae]